MWGAIVLVILALVISYVIKYVHKWYHPKCNGVLPPGSFGFPFIGETLGLIFPSRSLDLHPFLKNRIQKYGLIFKTSIAGRHAIVTADPNLNHYLFLEEGRSVELWYLDSFTKLFAQDGAMVGNKVAGSQVHRYIRSLTLNHFGAESVKERILPQLQHIMRQTFDSWCTHDTVELKHAILTMVFKLSGKIMFGYEHENSLPETMCKSFKDFTKIMISFPVNIPGTTFYQVMKEKKKMTDIIKERVRERRLLSSSNLQKRQNFDLLDQALQDINTTQPFLNDDFIVQMAFAILFGSSESNSTALTLALKLLSENPKVVEELRAEHEAILNKRQTPNSRITWDEIKSMTFTLQVINETLRIGHSAPGMLRRAAQDIKFNGYTIPAGWTIMIASAAQQMNPHIFNDPLAFNPWRWKEIDWSVVSKNFMPFGGGARQCAGAVFSKAFMCAFLHVLVTGYKWEVVKTSRITRMPLLSFGDGIHINITKI